MDHYKGTGKVDPDYESYNSAVEFNEEEDKKENFMKIRKIIEDEYNREIVQRQEQIEQIELQICKVRKLLHLLRYVLIMSYYKKKELEYNGSEEASTSDSFVNADKQNRIHPAVKKLLGRNITNVDYLNIIKNKRKSHVRNNVSSENKLSENINSPESKKIKLDLDDNQRSENKIHNEISHKNHDRTMQFVRSRKKTKYRIIVGNISKWMPSSEDDLLTHKWMMYVRGPKEEPDVSHFIDKVVYYLHPSYKPHDVVEVSESPFHLSRRGWGEFPVRVQIFFKVKLNKPIDVVHNIKLDKTYSGRQTLGNETIIDVFLYDDNVSSVSSVSEEVEIREIKLETEEQLASTSVEHDYCSEIVTDDEKNLEITNEHSYSLPPSLEGLSKPKKEKIEQDESNMLIYGLDTYCNDFSNQEKNKQIKTLVTTNNVKHFIKLNRKDIKFCNTKIIVFGKKLEGSFLSNFKLVQNPREVTVTNKIETNNLKVTLPKNRFKNMGEALPYLFKRLPLYTDLANNVIYKRMYPFTASTLKEFVSWNVGKRRSSEWSRARTIKKILIEEKIHGVENWNTKAILMYGRSHDYTPFVSYGLFSRNSKEKELLLTCYENSQSRVRNSIKFTPQEEPDVTVNVDSDIDLSSPKKNKIMIDISDPRLKMECSYVRHTALDCGIILKPEEITDGVKVNGAELMILEAVKSLAETLIRRAKNHRICTRTSSSSITDTITRGDVETAMNERSEMLPVLLFKSERRNFDYFS